MNEVTAMNAEMWQAWGPYVLAGVAIFLGFLRNMNSDRKVELQMQGLYVQMSKEDRAARDNLQRKVDDLMKQVNEYRVQHIQAVGERNQLKLTLQKEREVHDAMIARYEARITAYEKSAEIMAAQIKDMERENTELKSTVATLKQEIAGLQSRIEAVAKRAETNATELEKERQSRIAVEAERDALKQERDSLKEQVEALGLRVDQLTLELAKLETEKDDDKLIH